MNTDEISWYHIHDLDSFGLKFSERLYNYGCEISLINLW